MINIRYHIVSITAVFLALGIGVALGTTFLDGATVDVLNKNISSAESRIKQANDKIDSLEDQRAAAATRDAGLVLLGSDRLLGDQLTDQPVLIVAEPGLGDDALAALLAVLDRSGADLRGTLALNDRLSFADRDEALATAIGLAPDATAAALRSEVQDQLIDALIAAGAAAPEDPEVPDPEESEGDGETTTTVDATTTAVTTPEVTTTTAGEAPDVEDPAALDGTQPDIVTVLLDRGYLELAAGPGYSSDDPILESPGYRYVFVGSAAPRASDAEVLLRLLPGTGSDPIPAVVVAPTTPVETDGEGAPTTNVVGRVRRSEQLVVRYSTVDDLETFAGLAATVFAVADLDVAPVGHFGQAEGATALLPPPR